MKNLLLVLILATFSAYSAENTIKQLGTEQGRFVFGDLQNDELFMLDTKTGRLWKLEGNASEPGKLIPIPYSKRNAQGNITYTPEQKDE